MNTKDKDENVWQTKIGSGPVLTHVIRFLVGDVEWRKVIPYD